MRRWARPLALAVIRRDEAILVFEVPDEVEGITGYRPPGGTIEFGERSEDAVIREIREELSAELTDLRHLGTLENIFRFRGEASHEIIVVYEGRFADATLYERETIDGVEANGEPLPCSWRRLADFGPRAPLYPDGLLELLTQDASGRRRAPPSA